MEIKAFLITLGAGLFFLVGYLLNAIFKNKKAFYQFAVSSAFVIMIGLILFDLLPEIFEHLTAYSLLIRFLVFGGSFIAGILLLIMLDKFVPHHDHDHHDNEKNHEEHFGNMYHIGLVTSIALVLHNIIEGSAIYVTSLTDIKSGLLIALGVTLHNIPLGMEISSTLNLSNKPFKKKLLPILLISISTAIGALVMILLKVDFSPLINGILISLTMGMVVYIAIFELLKEVLGNLRKKSTLFGLLCGIILIIISLFL